MIPVILSGGSGSRLWPMSRQLYPKQFLPLMGSNTMFQDTLLRLPEFCDAPIVVSNQEHRFIVEEQLLRIQQHASTIILEPFGRNTAPAVALAAFEIVDKGADALMLVLPADHHIESTAIFHKALEQAALLAAQGHLVLFGITPDKPETGYGYIQCGTTLEPGFTVERFVEKPDYDTAVHYLTSGDYLWNSGMFLMSAQLYLNELKNLFPDMYDLCELSFVNSKRDGVLLQIPASTFEHCPNDSIDYAVMEKTSRAAIVPLDAGWNDLGAWSSLWDTSTKDTQDNVLVGDVMQQDSHGCYVRGGQKLVALVGVDDLVVVDTADAVMIAHKDKVQDVKKVVGKLNQAQRSEASVHRQVYRPWGNYESIDLGPRFQVKHISVKPGASLSLQKHHHRAEHWVVVKGTAEVTCGEKTFLLCENQSTYIPIGELHRLTNPGKITLEIIEIQSGSYLGEDDIVRIEDRYGRTQENPTDTARPTQQNA